jgi:hypothetical protein
MIREAIRENKKRFIPQVPRPAKKFALAVAQQERMFQCSKEVRSHV